MKTIQEINSRLSAIADELRSDTITTEQVKALQEEIRQLNDAKAQLQQAASQAEELRKMIAAGEVPTSSHSNPEGNAQETRAAEFMKTKRTSTGVKEMRSILVSGGTIATPTGVSGINDLPGRRVSSIVGLVNVVPCEGMGSNLVAYVAADPAAAGTQTEGSAGATKEPTFGYVTITPTSIACVAQISKQSKKQSPLDYLNKVNSLAYLSLRKKAAALIVGQMAASTLVDEVEATVSSNKGVIDETTLRKLVLAYGGDEDVVGGAVLFLNKTDLTAFGDVRGTNEKKAVYEITPDTDNPNMGIIQDGGLAVRYCICSGLTACAGTSESATADIKTMFYGDPKCFELDLFSGYEVRVSEDFAITSLMDTIVGDAEIGGDVVVNKGFVTLVIPKNP